jgi:hypothetical protein
MLPAAKLQEINMQPALARPMHTMIGDFQALVEAPLSERSPTTQQLQNNAAVMAPNKLSNSAAVNTHAC